MKFYLHNDLSLCIINNVRTISSVFNDIEAAEIQAADIIANAQSEAETILGTANTNVAEIIRAATNVSATGTASKSKATATTLTADDKKIADAAAIIVKEFNGRYAK